MCLLTGPEIDNRLLFVYELTIFRHECIEGGIDSGM